MSATGKTAYEAYAEAAGGVSLVSGDALPVWEELGDPVRAAWEHVADVLRVRFVGGPVGPGPARAPVLGGETGGDTVAPIVIPVGTPQPL